MKRFTVFFILFLCSFTPDAPYLDKEEAKNAFEFLNKMRTDKYEFYKAMHFTLFKTMPSLNWNDTLAKAAERKALDMAKRDYFAHVDPDGRAMNYYINEEGYTLRPAWLKSKKDNFF